MFGGAVQKGNPAKTMIALSGKLWVMVGFAKLWLASPSLENIPFCASNKMKSLAR